MKKRIVGGQQLVEFLESGNQDIRVWNNVDKIVDALSTFWVSSSNYKVCHV